MKKRTVSLKLTGLILVLVLGLFGCNSVTTMEPIGAADAQLDSASIEGTWQGEVGVVLVKKSKDGVYKAGVMGWDDETQEFKAMNMNLTFTEAGDRKYIHLQTLDEDEATSGLFFAEYKITDDKKFAVIWSPNVAEFKKLVQSEILKGSVDSDGNVILSGTSKELGDRLSSDEPLALFDYREPLILQKVNGKE